MTSIVHCRVDQSELNSERKFACGIGPELPEGHKWIYESEWSFARMVTCPGCGGSPAPVGIEAKHLNGNAAQRHENPREWDNWVRLSESWGYP